MNPNRQIYERFYSGKHFELAPDNRYDLHYTRLRQRYIEQYGFGRDVLDLCCGSGAYLIPVLGRVARAIGVDFSPHILEDFRRSIGSASPDNLTLLRADAAALPLRRECVDFIFSYSALYTVPGIDRVLAEARRVLRPGGHAVLELGNRHSINMLVCNAFHRYRGWAKPYFVPYAELRRLVAEAGFEVVEWRSFQLINNYGVPWQLAWLYPVCAPLWKHVLGIEVKGRMLDEWLSSCGPLRALSFRHLVLVRRP